MYKIAAVLGTLLVAAAGVFMPRLIVEKLDKQDVYEYDLELAMIEYKTEEPETPPPSDELKALRFPFYPIALNISVSESVMHLTPQQAENLAFDAMRELEKYSLIKKEYHDDITLEECKSVLYVAPPGLLYGSDELYSMAAEQVMKMCWSVYLSYGSGAVSFSFDDKTGKISNFIVYNFFLSDREDPDYDELMRNLLDFLESYYGELDFSLAESPYQGANQGTYAINAADKSGESLRLYAVRDDFTLYFNSGSGG